MYLFLTHLFSLDVFGTDILDSKIYSPVFKGVRYPLGHNMSYSNASVTITAQHNREVTYYSARCHHANHTFFFSGSQNRGIVTSGRWKNLRVQHFLAKFPVFRFRYIRFSDQNFKIYLTKMHVKIESVVWRCLLFCRRKRTHHVLRRRRWWCKTEANCDASLHAGTV